ncbi:recombination-associated protein RdgC [Parahaliea mediterranea]|uniref:recombination-associated protein RdgC n=1 Tax=Parahaliea mediterranea TaxID=651086 RepID=UPI000E2F70C0|nr:recombination-associated protein RdgC [Parahaliea mediterranea]
MFKSITVYQLTQATDAVLRALEEHLPKRPFTPCTQHDASSAGWVPPLGEDAETLTYGAQGCTLFCLRTDTKSVSAGAVKLAVAKRVKAFEQDNPDPASPVDKRLFKEEVTQQFVAAIPGECAAPSYTWAYIDRQLSMLFVGASEDGADGFIAVLKKTLDALPVKLLKLTEVEPCDKFTEWLKDPATLGEKFQLGDAVSMKRAKEGGTEVANISHAELSSEYLQTWISEGAECCRIGLAHEKATFAITAKLGLRRFKLPDEPDEDEEGDDPLDNTQYRFVRIADAVRAVMIDVEPNLGGFPTQELLDLHDEQEGEVAA